MVTREEVVSAYRLLLGREPESEAVIEGHLAAADWGALRDRFVRSAEFVAKLGNFTHAGDPLASLLAGPARVDVQIPEHLFDRLLRRVQEVWEGLGAEKPYWSVITDPAFLPDTIKATRDEFYESGVQSWQFCECAAARAGKSLSAEWTAFELGCGVGRVTAQLARRFRQVIACDISRAHLEIARDHLGAKGIDNVEFRHLAGIGVLSALDRIDFFYSIIVLQHNPPPLIGKILDILFAKVRPGGCAYFQVPVALEAYSFAVDEYLDWPTSDPTAMETHLIPQTDLFRLLDKNRFRILDLQRDIWQPPPFISFSILAEKIK